MAKVDDEFRVRENGTVRMVIDGKVHDLRRPTLGEFRRFREGVIALNEYREPTDEVDVESSSSEQLAAMEDRRLGSEEALLGWWRDVVATLDANSGVLPDDPDGFPAWFVGPTLIPSMITAWMTVPTVPGN